MQHRKLYSLVGATVLMLGALGASPASATDTSTAPTPVTTSTSCKDLAEEFAAADGLDTAGGIEFACTPTALVVQEEDSNAKIQRELVPAEQQTLRATAAASSVCDPTKMPERYIVSELESNVYFCVLYGQVNSPINGTWTRSINVEWIMFTGWNSAQNKIRTVPSAGTPTLKGTVSSQKQNGVLPPTKLATSLWSNKGNTTTTGWNVGGLTRSGSHSVVINDLHVTDPGKGYKIFVGGNIATHRFTCNTGTKRCYYPNMKEAPL